VFKLMPTGEFQRSTTLTVPTEHGQSVLSKGSDGGFSTGLQTGNNDAAGNRIQIDGNGNVTTLHTFNRRRRWKTFPTALIEGGDGNLYGTRRMQLAPGQPLLVLALYSKFTPSGTKDDTPQFTGGDGARALQR